MPSPTKFVNLSAKLEGQHDQKLVSLLKAGQ